MALRAPAVQVDGDVGAVQRGGGHGQRRRVRDGVDRAGELRERRERGRRREHQPVLGIRITQRTQRGDAGQQVAEPERPIGDEQRPGHGQDGSDAGATSSSRSSQPAGWRRANRTVRATSAGSLRC